LPFWKKNLYRGLLAIYSKACQSGVVLIIQLGIYSKACQSGVVLTLFRMTKDEKGLAFFKGLLL
jgi:hypothetical protein